jgi:hypothetical protein|tara:strand:- start:278 stop:436 length:159 start_codon:yes stop_codon:yes gene_type:complete
MKILKCDGQIGLGKNMKIESEVVVEFFTLKTLNQPSYCELPCRSNMEKCAFQ